MENRIKECQLDLYADRTSAAIGTRDKAMTDIGTCIAMA
jgi:hypothetical protein